MIRAQLILAASAIAFASGCDDSQPTQPSRPIVVRSQAQDQLHQLDDMNRAIALRRAIFDSGSRCKRVTESGYVTEHGNLSMWTASCDDGRRWAIFVAPDESVQVRNCEGLADIGLPECVIREPARPATEADGAESSNVADSTAENADGNEEAPAN